MGGPCLLGSVVGPFTAGCKGCDDHPYVPYSIDAPTSAARADDAAAPLAAPEEDAGGAFAEQPAVVAPPDTTRWSLEGLTLDSPVGHGFAVGLVRDFDGDGANAARAIARPA